MCLFITVWPDFLGGVTYRHIGGQSRRFDLEINPLPTHVAFLFVMNALKTGVLSVISQIQPWFLFFLLAAPQVWAEGRD